MTLSTLHSRTDARNDFRTRMTDHEVNGVTILGSGTADAAVEVTRYMHGLAAYFAATLPERENTNYNAGERRVDLLNPEITAAAWEAMSYLAGLANFFATEAACER